MESKRNETVWGDPEQPPQKGKQRIPKYKSLADIFKRYDSKGAMGVPTPIEEHVPADVMTSLIEGAFADDVQF